MFADLARPPTFVADWPALGFPAGVIVFLAVMASLFSVFVVLARRRIHKGWLVFLCVGLFIGADLIVYVVGRRLPRPPRNGPDLLEKERNESQGNQGPPGKTEK
jgi:hypothetical protein